MFSIMNYSVGSLNNMLLLPTAQPLTHQSAEMAEFRARNRNSQQMCLPLPHFFLPSIPREELHAHVLKCTKMPMHVCLKQPRRTSRTVKFSSFFNCSYGLDSTFLTSTPAQSSWTLKPGASVPHTCCVVSLFLY